MNVSLKVHASEEIIFKGKKKKSKAKKKTYQSLGREAREDLKAAMGRKTI